jgi:hypothetical protein
LTLLTGRAGTITERDDDIFTDLFFCGAMSEPQIARGYFTSSSRAHNRLYELKRKGYLDNARVHPAPMLWYLTRAGRERQAELLGVEPGDFEAAPTARPSRVHHLIDTVELYVMLRPGLDESLGPYPSWSWRSEKAAREDYVHAGEEYHHQPDAHLELPGCLFIVERQTRRARSGPVVLDEKVRNHRRYVQNVLQRAGETDVLFACDERRDAEAVRRAGERYGVSVIAGSPTGIVRHVLDTAQQIADELLGGPAR